MKIFALDTSSKIATIGILEDGKVLLENTLNDKKTHSENLMPMIEAAFQSVNLTPEDIDVFGVTVGPGAFTGLRIGISAVKGMAEALNKPVVGLSAPEVLAAGIAPTDRIICPIMDAQREQVYAGFFRYRRAENTEHEPQSNCNGATMDQHSGDDSEPRLRALMDTKVIKVRDLIEEAAQLEGKILFLGDGVNLYEKILREGLGEAFEKTLYGHRIPRASMVGALTERKHREGKSHGADRLKPIYLRKSQAEVQFDERQKSLGKEVSE
ncbi:tRNA (adenosine(37)-N6)-threonylcarbamoyltransferase complex dimerization subunit type 1 TsaB [Isachenkonia alkalipeptolytica]|uniref:tRNA (Adenosine(37)-N6)-threonylcarbamoyltransferase complex dimerization subunit type 1 TsaB n=1 Tax=Isachenkonia alkalipeptolytica TaxID=2565777 RepID=A0AA43XN03_9CLOT|nr:tRNA (adenosine(37)-N6)-threonylcarbamoyltransferase complex dimerization subunit type 1 TsaB [Isachenkonia alkalipeptolytica]NBG89376.1 tRNA (adenosine(37)-N6)-threonylcarbamoyltransferase complex dimerization subunit type 1 TsaB [Isachenkonia alkalipeptolytica]